jgi:leucine dehydrogenase
MVHILDAMAREHFEEVIALHDRKSGLRAFLGLHSTVRGPAFGGIRRWAYGDERRALLDCLRLSRAMTYKCALADLPAGGAKVVLFDQPDLDLEGAYRYLGEVVERMAGRFYTGPDVGTGARELSWVSGSTSYVTDPGPEGPGELAASTAEGVFASVGAVLRQLDGEEDWSRRTVVVQGLGAVGLELVRRLLERGVHVVGADIDPRVAKQAREDLEFELVEAPGEFDVPCDVFAPCALGGILHDLTVKRLRARAVAGAANNVLAGSVHGDRLHERGVLYAPDFVTNSGALIRGSLFHLEGRRESVEAIGERVGRSVEEILALAAARDRPPARIAAGIAEQRLGRSVVRKPAPLIRT